jgi:hypothetical protein
MGSQLLNITLADGESVTLQDFIWASILPASGATFTLSNTAPPETDVNETTSGPLNTAFSTGNSPSQQGWEDLTVTASGGDVYIEYCKG